LSLGRFLRDLAIVLAGLAGAVWGAEHWIAVPWIVEGPSMDPTLRDGDRVIVDLWSLRRRTPRNGEIVLLAGPADEPLVKRVARAPAGGAPPSLLPPDSPLEPTFFVLGDNPGASSDSRAFGPVPRHRIRGRVTWRYWPVSGMGPIE
jgi:signal peptidase I